MPCEIRDRSTMGPKATQHRRVFFGVCRYQAAFPSGYALAWVETETSEITERPNAALGDLRTERRRGILNNWQAAPPCDISDRRHVSGETYLVDGNQGFRTRRDGSLN